MRSSTSDSPRTSQVVAGAGRARRRCPAMAAARVVGRGVQRLEVVVVGLDLGALRHRVAQAQEDLGDLVDDAVDEMARAHLLGAARQRHVHGRRLDGRGSSSAASSAALRSASAAFHLHARRVHGLAHAARALQSGTCPMLTQVARSACRTCPAPPRAPASSAPASCRLRDLRPRCCSRSAANFLHDCHTVRLSSLPTARCDIKEPSSVPPGAACGLPGIQGREKALAVPPRLATAPATRRESQCGVARLFALCDGSTRHP